MEVFNTIKFTIHMPLKKKKKERFHTFPCVRSDGNRISYLIHEGDDSIWLNNADLLTLQCRVCPHPQPSTVLGNEAAHLKCYCSDLIKIIFSFFLLVYIK